MRVRPMPVMTPRKSLLPSVLTNVYHNAFHPLKKLLAHMVHSDAVLRWDESAT